jgi:hypothetical protein
MDAIKAMASAGGLAMTAWQYAQLTITRDIRTGEVHTILWRGPGQGLGEAFTDSGQSVLELLNRVGADDWELADREERQERGDGPRYWDPNWAVTIYTSRTWSRASKLGAAAQRRAADVPVIPGMARW